MEESDAERRLKTQRVVVQTIVENIANDVHTLEQIAEGRREVMEAKQLTEEEKIYVERFLQNKENLLWFDNLPHGTSSHK